MADRGGRPRRARAWRLLGRLAVVGLVAFVLVQFVPYGWAHPNPPVIADAPWPTPESAALARAACYDCHSNETEWPFYAYVAPMSWFVRRDVEQGRRELNFSLGERVTDDAAEAVADGSMPPRGYRALHPGARLSDQERDTLVQALTVLEETTEGADGGGDGDAGGDEDHSGRGGGGEDHSGRGR
ncbi:MAG: cytochrome C [Acidimicrobiia bacterium]|nr:cytochrome C [Acidimicrobiia bacterium]